LGDFDGHNAAATAEPVKQTKRTCTSCGESGHYQSTCVRRNLEHICKETGILPTKNYVEAGIVFQPHDASYLALNRPPQLAVNRPPQLAVNGPPQLAGTSFTALHQMRPRRAVKPPPHLDCYVEKGFDDYDE